MILQVWGLKSNLMILMENWVFHQHFLFDILRETDTPSSSKWPPFGGSKGHFEEAGTYPGKLLNFCNPENLDAKLETKWLDPSSFLDLLFGPCSEALPASFQGNNRMTDTSLYEGRSQWSCYRDHECGESRSKKRPAKVICVTTEARGQKPHSYYPLTICARVCPLPYIGDGHPIFHEESFVMGI